MIPREVKLPEKNSYFLFGARGTGKSTLVKDAVPESQRLYINLLLAREEDIFARDPDQLIRRVRALGPSIKTVIIDEVQKVPKLLDAVHELIESTNIQFILTGSSAKKLKAGGANLLAGRAVTRSLFPFTFHELGLEFDLDQAMRWGSLPRLLSLDSDFDRSDYLQAYALTYLKEEVWAEQFVRKLDPFRKFLEVAAICSGKIINFSNIARDVGIDSKTVKSYYEIIEETLLGFFLPSFSTSQRKNVYKSAKFYFFDVGVTRSLARLLEVPPTPRTSYFGELFEQFVILEIYKKVQYSHKQYRLSYLQTQAGNEVDLVVERPGASTIVVEVKSTTEITEHKISGMKNFFDVFPGAKFLCLSLDPNKKKFGKIEALPWSEGIAQII